MQVEVIFRGHSTMIETAVNMDNCFKPEYNPVKMRQLPLLFKPKSENPDEDAKEECVGSVDRIQDGEYVIHIMDIDAPIYDYIYDNIDKMKLTVSRIQGGDFGYMFIMKEKEE